MSSQGREKEREIGEMNGRGILKKPKREIESDVEEENNKIDNNICGSNNVVNDDHPETVSTSNYEEQEEALVALIEHRTKEVEHLQNRVSYYQSQVSFCFPILMF